MEVWIQVSDGRVQQAKFITDGCGSSAACGSMATELANGRTFDEAYCLEQRDVLDAIGGLPKEIQHCALLAADTLRAACEDYIMNNQPQRECESAMTASCESCDSATCSAKHRRQNESEQEFAERQELVVELAVLILQKRN